MLIALGAPRARKFIVKSIEMVTTDLLYLL